jgi:hypothetical protein
MAGGALRGRAVDARGRPHADTIDATELFLTLLSGDADPALRAAFPGAVRAALAGDRAPLLRLKRRSFSIDAEPPPPGLLSTALYTATTCEELALPWPRSTPADPAARRRLAQATAAAIPDSAFAPFDRATVLGNDILRLCDRWAAAPAPPAFGPGPLPDVPVLLLEGEDDLRTPVENARRVAALFPRAALVIAPATGHSVLGSDRSRCADRAFARFLTGRAVAESCPRHRRDFPARPPPPRSLRELAPARSPRARAVAALAATLGDVAEDSLTALILDERDPDLARGGGLRAGRYRLDGRLRLHLHGLSFVPGVRVSGLLRRFGGRQSGRVRLFGPAVLDGVLSVRGRRVRGRLGGRPVSARLASGARAARVRAAAARLPGPAGR